MKLTRLLVLILATLSYYEISHAQFNFKVESQPTSEPIPFRLRLGDLNEQWFTFTASNVVRNDTEYHVGRTIRSFYGGSGTGLYFSQGRVTRIGENLYLIAYSVTMTEAQMLKAVEESQEGEISAEDIAELMDEEDEDKPIPPTQKERLTPETPLVLSLINLRSIAVMDSIVPYNVAAMERVNKALHDHAAARYQASISEKNNQDQLTGLKMIGSAINVYVDSENKLPSLENVQQLMQDLKPYLGPDSESYFLRAGKTPASPLAYFEPNKRLSKKKLQHFEAYRDILVVLYEQVADKSGMRSVLYLNGTARRVNQEEWSQLSKVSKIE